MADRSKIEWTDATWNPLVSVRKDGKVGFHCEKVSPACAHCYAEAFNSRNLPARGTALPYTRASRDQVYIRLDEETRRQPLHWRRPRRIFVCSMTDLFGEFVPFGLIDHVFAVMALCARHTFQVLTKRPERMAEWFGTDRFQAAGRHGAVLGSAHFELHAEDAVFDWPLPNVWIGVTAEDQPRADERIPHLLRCPAAVRFVSYEPALGPIDLRRLQGECSGCTDPQSEGTHQMGTREHTSMVDGPRAIDWLICGGESGPHARPMHPDWARSVRDQCQAANVPFFFKQWGTWCPTSCLSHARFLMSPSGLACTLPPNGAMPGECRRPDVLLRRSRGTGRSRLLDGREWSEFPAHQEAATC